MQNSLRVLVLAVLLPIAGAVTAQQNVHIVCEGEKLQFVPESIHWGVPSWEFSPDDATWHTLALFTQHTFEIQPEETGYYRLKVYDASCDSSFYSNVQYIEVRKRVKSLQLHSTYPGHVFNPGDSLFFWVDGQHLPEGVEFWVNRKSVQSAQHTDLLLPALTESFTIHATAGLGDICFTSDTLTYLIASAEAKNTVPCETPYPQVQNLSAVNSIVPAGVNLSWDVITGSKGCNIRYRPAGTTLWSTQTVIQDDLAQYFVPASQLLPSTEYQWQLRCGCQINPTVAGPWSETNTFTTSGGPPPCELPYPQVQNLNSEELPSASGFQLSWTPIQQSIGCLIQYKVVGAPSTTNLQIAGQSQSQYVLAMTELQPSAEYQWRVRCGCSQNPLVAGPWSEYDYFETGAAPGTYPEGTVHCIPGGAEVVEVLNPATGKIWMDRNLGASQVASAANDVAAYGDLYQWGRFSDGHQCRNSSTTSTLSSSDTPGHGSFIIAPNFPYDWRSPQNNNLWQGVNGTNNPCPTGYRLPTGIEWNNERLSWTSNNGPGAFASPLKLTQAGYRWETGGFAFIGSGGFYWSRTVSGTDAGNLFLWTDQFSWGNSANLDSDYRADGRSVRCIKDVGDDVGMINNLGCGNATNAGSLVAGSPEGIAISTIPYSGGDGGLHDGQVVLSTGITGLTATLNPGVFNIGPGVLIYTITGTPSGSGTATFALNIGGKTCNISLAVAASTSYAPNAMHCILGGAEVVEVMNPATGKIWMDRNLGASQVATGQADEAAYGDIYQWGRFTDGHQCRNSANTGTFSLTDTPDHGDFILAPNYPNDWRTPQSNLLWQGLNGINNPCPTGYRLPSEIEWGNERLTWSSNNLAGAFASPLKLPAAGSRFNSTGNVVLGAGNYHSRTVAGVLVRYLSILGNASISTTSRASGRSVRCIKDAGDDSGEINTLGCEDATHVGTLIPGLAASGVSSTIPYTGGDGGINNGQVVFSTGVEGLTATLNPGLFNIGSGVLTYTISGTPTEIGTAFFELNIGGQACILTRNVVVQGSISGLECENAQLSGSLIENQFATGVSSSIPYTGGIAGGHTGEVVNSSGVPGLTATLNAGNFVDGAGTLIYHITGIPEGSGTATFALNLDGQACTISATVNPSVQNYPPNTVHCISGGTAVADVINPATGKVWMDRNLGASQVATALNDEAAYGDLYQWGRFSDGHQCRNSATTNTLSTSDTPDHGNFILSPDFPYDWRSTQNDFLWQGVNGINNPCPTGYRIPTEGEWIDESQSWTLKNSTGAFTSPLKLTAGGRRSHGTFVSVFEVGVRGNYYSRTVAAENARSLRYFPSHSDNLMQGERRAMGLSVRCIRNLVNEAGAVNTLGCEDASNTGTLVPGQAASDVSTTIPYTGGDGGIYDEQIIPSTGVTGLSATLNPGVFNNGSGVLTFTITGTPSAIGTAAFMLNIGGQACTLTRNVVAQGSINSLDCENAEHSGSLTEGQVADVSSSIPYSGGNAGGHAGQIVNSTGVTGLTATLNAGTFVEGSGTLIYHLTGTPVGNGVASFSLSIGGQACTLSLSVNQPAPPSYPVNTEHCIAGGAEVIEVMNPATGRIWMDRNLGASQVATAINDESAYGDLYQWGRFSDGHQCRNSGTTIVTANTPFPPHGDFIYNEVDYTWLSPNNNNLWQGVNGINNPCPEGFRLPTSIEWDNERNSWNINNSAGAFASPLKLPAAGYRLDNISFTGSLGSYQSSSIGAGLNTLLFSGSSASLTNYLLGTGVSVRCIKGFDQDEAQINTLECGDATLSGSLLPGVLASGVSISVPYSGGNGGFFAEQEVMSSGIPGLTATLDAGNLNIGTGSLTYQIGGTPLGIGTASFDINVLGQSCTLNIDIVLEESISSLECDSAEHIGILTPGEALSGVSSTIAYGWGNGDTYGGQEVASYGVTGLTATLIAGAFNDGPGSLTYTITGTPESGGMVYFDVNIGGQSCTFTRFVSISGATYPTGTVHCISSGTLIVEVINPATGQIWMDRNLGANQVATAPNDVNAHGDLYQWGRFSDGHQCRNSPYIAGLSTSDTPGHGGFIISIELPLDWRIPKNDNLWQGVNGINNPCPTGFRLPTSIEWDIERASWTGGFNSAGAFASPLKLTLAGQRDIDEGISDVGHTGYYWSSTVVGNNAGTMAFWGSSVNTSSSYRSYGHAVRCLKDQGENAGQINTLGCGDATLSGGLLAGVASSNVNLTVPYTGGNGGLHGGQVVMSTGITGLTATLNPGAFNAGPGALTYSITGTPSGVGTASFGLNIGGNMCSLDLNVSSEGSINSLDCDNADLIGALTENQVAINMSFSVPYTGGNGGGHTGQTAHSTGVTGLTATLNANPFAEGDGTLIYHVTGVPVGNGMASFALSLAGQACTISWPVAPAGPPNYPTGTVHCFAGGAEVVEVINAATGRIWMDRNLGASQVATSATDQNAYGDLYQWGRLSDGHQCRNSTTTSTLSASDTPGHGSFILSPSPPQDWRSPQNNNLWQGMNAINNPCPEGFRPPTIIEWNNELETWPSQNITGAFASPLKLTAAGRRNWSAPGALIDVGSVGYYWSSSASNTNSSIMRFWQSNADNFNFYRSMGYSVRCTKELNQDAGQINTLECEDATLTGSLIPGVPASGVSFAVPYTNGNGGTYEEQVILSTGVTGLSATLSAGNFFLGAGMLTYSISGIPLGTGTASFALNIGGQSCTFNLSLEIVDAGISTLECDNAEHTGILTPGVELSGVSSAIPYAWSNGDAYDGQVLPSYGVTGLTATLAAGTFNEGPGMLTYTITGTPQSSGLVNFDINIGGLSCTLNRFVSVSGAEYPNGTDHCISTGTIILEVMSPSTGQIWMDRNLGASQVATASNDEAGYGDLYQWGRFSDGHQCRNSLITSVISDDPFPDHGDFILGSSTNWFSTVDNNLWKGVSGINNPCPTGFRLPSKSEWNNEVQSWPSISNKIVAAFESPLKLTPAGRRDYNFSAIGGVGSSGHYWSSTVSGFNPDRLRFTSSSTNFSGDSRIQGLSVRCIKDLGENAGQIDGLGCFLATFNGVLLAGVAASGVSSTVPYSGGNGGLHGGQVVMSTGVTGLTATLNPGAFNDDEFGELIYSITGTPSGVGTASFGLNIGGKMCNLSLAVLAEGSINSLNCDNADLSGTLTENQAAINVSFSVPYSGGNGGGYAGQTALSTGVTGLTATLNINSFAVGAGTLIYHITGVPVGNGMASFALNLAGQACTVSWPVASAGPANYPPGTVHCIAGGAEVVEVINPATGRIWMDRNLGASQVATSATDQNAYGDLYQWGRLSDGHQCRNSPTTSALSSTDSPEHGQFILGNSSSKWDWRSPLNNNLWQGINGINNPCPEGFRPPTLIEWNSELGTWISQNTTGAYASSLKLSAAGRRNWSIGVIQDVGSQGYYWSSSVFSTNASIKIFLATGVSNTTYSRSAGSSVRCIKD